MRHAPPRRTGVCAGRFDLPVEDAGPKLESIHGLLRVWGIDHIFSSPAPRCRDVANQLATRLQLPVRVDDRLQELDFGQWEGRPFSAIETGDKDCFESWSRNWLIASPPGGESVAELEQRLANWLSVVPNENVLVLTHAGPIRALRVLLQHQSWEFAMSNPVPYLVPLVLASALRESSNPSSGV